MSAAWSIRTGLQKMKNSGGADGMAGGMEGGSAAAELLCGVGSPSGKLSDTFAKKLEDYPSSETFHESVKYVDYKEDIYVGYRYFETIPGADKAVNYPFGYGLSYTTFERALVSAEEKQGVIRVRVNVTNTGKYPGKEVMQLYAQAPQGVLERQRESLQHLKNTTVSTGRNTASDVRGTGGTACIL